MFFKQTKIVKRNLTQHISKMELTRINIYINEHLWEYFQPNERINIFFHDLILFTTEEFKDAKQFIKILHLNKYGVIEKWKMLSVNPHSHFEGLDKISYQLYTEQSRKSGRYENVIHFNEKYRKTCFGDYENSINTYYEEKDLFAEFYFLPQIWYENNHHLWPKQFQEDVENVKKYSHFHKDIKFCIIQALGRLCKGSERTI